MHEQSLGIESLSSCAMKNQSYCFNTTVIQQGSSIVTTFRIADYDFHNSEMFLCGAYNKWGVNISRPLIARRRISKNSCIEFW